MGMWDRVRAWLSNEGRELGEVGRDLGDRLDRDLTERERRLNETPTEAVERLQAEAEANDSVFADLEDRIAGRGFRADATTELTDDPADEATDTSEN